jgi:hypothetical protein
MVPQASEEEKKSHLLPYPGSWMATPLSIFDNYSRELIPNGLTHSGQYQWRI